MIWQHRDEREFLKPTKGMHIVSLPQHLQALAAVRQKLEARQ